MRYGRSGSKYCSVPRCGLPAYCYCRTDSRLFCRSHVGQHHSQGHEVLAYVCDLCDGHGTVHAQYASSTPGGRWVRCPKCFGVGFLRNPPKGARPRGRTGQGARERADTGERQRSEQRGGDKGQSGQRERVDASVDYYAVLGVSSSASAEAIKEAYRRLIKQYHPDLNPGSQEALDKTKGLNRAYDVLSNSERRREYDRERAEVLIGGTYAARRAWEAEKRARAAEWVAREAKRKAEEERRAREAGRVGRAAARMAEEERRARGSASKGGNKRPGQEAQGHKTDAGRGQHRGGKKIWRCLILTFLILLIAGGAVGVYLALPYFVEEGEDTGPSSSPTPAPPITSQSPTSIANPLSPTPTTSARTSTPAPAVTPLPTPTPVPFPLPTEMQSPATDREVLVRLYEATDGPNWTDNRNWLTDAPIGNWYGVDTDSDGRVTFLFLIDNNLNGVVPINLLNLGELNNLLMEGNPLSGCIAEELREAISNDDLNKLGLPTCDLVPTPVPSPTPIPTPTPVPTATPIPTPKPTSTPAPTATPKPTATPRPTATPTPSPKFIGGQLLDPQRIETWVIYYTNEERRKVGIAPIHHRPRNLNHSSYAQREYG